MIRTCARCGQETERRGYLCAGCKAPKRSARDGAVFGRALSSRERQIAVMVARGMLNKEIAFDLRLSEATIKDTVFRVFRKTGARKRTELALSMCR